MTDPAPQDAAAPAFHRVAQPPRPWWRLRRAPLLAALVLGLGTWLGLAVAYRTTGQIDAIAQARSYREAGRRWIVDDQPERALPYLVAARRLGDESALSKRLFRLATGGLEPRVLDAPRGESRGAFSPDGNKVAIFTRGNVRLWSASTALQERELHLRRPLDSAEPYSITFSSEGQLLALMTDRDRFVLDLGDKASVLRPLLHRGNPHFGEYEVPHPPEAHPDQLDVSRDAPVMALIGRGGIEIYETPSFRLRTTLKGRAQAIHLSPDGTHLLALDGQQVTLWSLTTGEARELLRIPVERKRFFSATTAAFSPRGDRFALLLVDERGELHVQMRDTDSGSLIGRTRASSAEAGADARLFFSPTGRLHLVPQAPFRDLRVIPVDHFVGPDVFRSPDGTMIVASHPDYGARLWDAATSEPLTPWLAHYTPVTSATFSPSGDRLLTTSQGGLAALWDLAPDARSLAQWERLLVRSSFPTIAAAGIPKEAP